MYLAVPSKIAKLWLATPCNLCVMGIQNWGLGGGIDLFLA